MLKKIGVLVTLALVGLVVFGMLPKEMSGRLTKALVFLFVFGFAVRVGSYLLSL